MRQVMYLQDVRRKAEEEVAKFGAIVDNSGQITYRVMRIA
jgi:hypothetical protein